MKRQTISSTSGAGTRGAKRNCNRFVATQPTRPEVAPLTAETIVPIVRELVDGLDADIIKLSTNPRGLDKFCERVGNQIGRHQDVNTNVVRAMIRFELIYLAAEAERAAWAKAVVAREPTGGSEEPTIVTHIKLGGDSLMCASGGDMDGVKVLQEQYSAKLDFFQSKVDASCPNGLRTMDFLLEPITPETVPEVILPFSCKACLLDKVAEALNEVRVKYAMDHKIQKVIRMLNVSSM